MVSNSASQFPILAVQGNENVVVESEDSVVHFPPLGPTPKILMVWPRFPESFWGMEGIMSIVPERSVLPPLALATVAALLPPQWDVRILDRALTQIHDRDIFWADMVMISAMYVQVADLKAVLARCRRLGRRTVVGGPFASTQPEYLLPLADHLVIGEAEEAFAAIAADFESGRARRIYRIREKPDIRKSPLPRYELLHLKEYGSMPVQFSRGCPFECEFCDIITIYGRRPRTKLVGQVMAELERLYDLGWRKQVFIVDDNFIGNRKAALELTRELIQFQRERGYPFSFYTQASIDLADQHELLDAMVEAGFLFVFIGIETPSPESLKEAKKYQNLRKDTLEQIRVIQRRGLWVTGGFIIGFDSDDEHIFARQTEFIEDAAIPWAMLGTLQAPPTTALYDRLKASGRLLDQSKITSFGPPNFQTVLPLKTLLLGLRQVLLDLYECEGFFYRTLRSLDFWQPSPLQRLPPTSRSYHLRVVAASLWVQGICGRYRRSYWRFLAALLRRWSHDPARLWMGFLVMLSAHHLLRYARHLADELQKHSLAAPDVPSSVTKQATASGIS